MDRRLFQFTVCAGLLISPTVDAAEKKISGEIQSIDVGKSLVRVDDLELEVTRKTSVVLDGKESTIKDLKPGLKVRIIYDDRLEAAISIANTSGDESASEVVVISELPFAKTYASHSLSLDGMSIYWEGPDDLIWVATRKSMETQFSDPRSLQIRGRHPTISSDESELIIVMPRDDGKKGESLHVAKWVAYYNTVRSHTERNNLPPMHAVPEEVPKLDRDQILVRSYVGGLVRSFERKAA